MAQCPECGTQTPIPFPSSKAEAMPPATPPEYVQPVEADRPTGSFAGSGSAPPAGGSPFDSQTGENPYQSPKQSWQTAAQYSPENIEYAKTRVSGPAIGLIVTAALGLLTHVGSLIFAIAAPAMVGNNPNAQQMPNFMQPQFGIGISLAQNAIGIGLAILVLMGGIKMNKLESYSLAMAASIIAVIPCFSPCCLLGIPIGIWALVALNDPNVKSAFKQ
jgi:hypothetical protein